MAEDDRQQKLALLWAEFLAQCNQMQQVWKVGEYTKGGLYREAIQRLERIVADCPPESRQQVYAKIWMMVPLLKSAVVARSKLLDLNWCDAEELFEAAIKSGAENWVAASHTLKEQCSELRRKATQAYNAVEHTAEKTGTEPPTREYTHYALEHSVHTPVHTPPLTASLVVQVVKIDGESTQIPDLSLESTVLDVKKTLSQMDGIHEWQQTLFAEHDRRTDTDDFRLQNGMSLEAMVALTGLDASAVLKLSVVVDTTFADTKVGKLFEQAKSYMQRGQFTQAKRYFIDVKKAIRHEDREPLFEDDLWFDSIDDQAEKYINCIDTFIDSECSDLKKQWMSVEEEDVQIYLDSAFRMYQNLGLEAAWTAALNCGTYQVVGIELQKQGIPVENIDIIKWVYPYNSEKRTTIIRRLSTDDWRYALEELVQHFNIWRRRWRTTVMPALYLTVALKLR